MSGCSGRVREVVVARHGLTLVEWGTAVVIDRLKIARSRKHILRHYDMDAPGPFPRRNQPVSMRSKLSLADDAISYHEIYSQIESMLLAVYMPSAYLPPSRVAKYAKDDKREGLTVAGRETGICKLMA